MKHPANEPGELLRDRFADGITRWAGSMPFVYLHALWFAVWILFEVEQYPFGLLTMIVSLEAIFLSTFVMISQNRADARRQAIADHDHVISTDVHTHVRKISKHLGADQLDLDQ